MTLCSLAVLWGVSLCDLALPPTRPRAPHAPHAPHAPLATTAPPVELATAERVPQPAVVRAPRLRPVQVASTAKSQPRDEDDAHEDQAMAASDRKPELRAWRQAWSAEDEDESWNRQVRAELRGVLPLVQGDVTLSDLSCRQTVCRMELQFADQLDAQAFIAAPHDDALQYAYQSMDPSFDGAGFDQSEYSYELLIKRPLLVRGGSRAAVVHAELVEPAEQRSDRDAQELRGGGAVAAGGAQRLLE